MNGSVLGRKRLRNGSQSHMENISPKQLILRITVTDPESSISIMGVGLTRSFIFTQTVYGSVANGKTSTI